MQLGLPFSFLFFSRIIENKNRQKLNNKLCFKFNWFFWIFLFYFLFFLVLNEKEENIKN